MSSEETTNLSPIEVYNHYLGLGETFEVSPKVGIELISQGTGEEDLTLNDVAASTAIQCYAPGDARMTTRSKEWERAVIANTLRAGHHTTRLHAYFTFRVEASRSVVHDVFHAHPYYNSEQQSQRYVEAREGFYIVRDLPEGQRIHFIEASNYMNHASFDMLEPLKAAALQRLCIVSQQKPAGLDNRKKLSERNLKRLEDKAKKISQEVARYTLPIGQKTKMFHTLSHLQLLRLFAAAESSNFSDEAKYIIAKMIEEVAEINPDFLQELPPIVPVGDNPFEESELTPTNEALRFFGNIEQGSHLLHSTYEPHLLFQMLGMPEDIGIKRALKYVFDPRVNPSIMDLFDTGIHNPITHLLQQIYFSFVTKLSHTANSQRQRHRTTLGTMPQISRDYRGADYITPMLIRENNELASFYAEKMKVIYQNYEKALALGISPENAQYLLPNAHAVYVYESGNLFNWAHRIRQRLCLLAQEEIFFITVEQAKAIGNAIPEAQQILLAPCGLRKIAKISPFCPEGDRYCGQPVYNWVPGEKFPDPLQQYTDQRMV